MQTFLPSTNFKVSALLLDSKRLNKQILEGYQILKVLSKKGKAWANHPAVLMWRNAEGVLATYVRAMISEASYRGIKVDKNQENLDVLENEHKKDWGQEYPDWFKDPKKINRLIMTHRANLFRKDPVYYVKFKDAVSHEFNKPCCPKCNYFWVTHKE